MQDGTQYAAPFGLSVARASQDMSSYQHTVIETWHVHRYNSVVNDSYIASLEYNTNAHFSLSAAHYTVGPYDSIYAVNKVHRATLHGGTRAFSEKSGQFFHDMLTTHFQGLEDNNIHPLSNISQFKRQYIYHTNIQSLYSVLYVIANTPQAA